MSQIQRIGTVSFGDASLSVWEEGISRAKGHSKADEWELQFKRQVFKRIVQTLNRLGWKCEVPEAMIKQYSLPFARNRRYCRKGDLQADLEISGRCIKLDMFQAVNCPERPDNNGRYEPSKERVMPYLIRLEMERTRRRISDYLCNVFEEYVFDKREQYLKIGPNSGQITAFEAAAIARRKSCHYVESLDRANITNKSQGISCDGMQLENGIKVYAMRRNGRMITGTAFYSLNGNWQIVSGRYSLEYFWHSQIWVNNPGNLRVRRDTGLRRKRLESELSKAIKAMNFERAAVLRDIIFPKQEPLFAVWHKEHELYHRAGHCGYTSELIDAGKFTAAELKGVSTGINKIIPMEATA